MPFPQERPRRLRATPGIRALVRETVLRPDDFVMPFFVRPGKGLKRPIKSMPGQFQLSVDELVKAAAPLASAGVPGVILFGIPDEKDAKACGAYAKDGIIQKAARALKDRYPDLTVMADLCFCEYTDHGHCGVVRKDGGIDNDATLELAAVTAVSQAEAGCDVVAPSGMMDGQVAAIRYALDEKGFKHTVIMGYSAKYASAFYGPFREAAESAPQAGDRKAYQMDPANAREALTETALDVEEGADIIMVKPALAYLDIISLMRDNFEQPLAAYNVSGEYSMVKAAAERGWADERACALEMLTAMRRAGADIIITYWAKDAAEWLAE